MPDQIDEIKQKLDLVQLIGEYVKLTRAGAVNWKGRCPFHNEKSPSFFVNEERQYYHCFGCNQSGDAFTFVQKMEGLDFPEALRMLAQKAGVEIQKFDERAVSRKNRLSDICDLAARFWQRCLREPIGKAAFEYIQKRGLTEAVLEEFKIGYAPDSWDATLNYLRGKGFNESEIVESGLAIRKEHGSGVYDRFRDRITFPIFDLHGSIVGFTARAMKSEEGAKYINTPESPIYHKGSVLFGLDKAKTAIRTQDYAVVVEGNMDAIACQAAGYKNVVACSGTALTQEQIKLLKRYSENIMLCLDQDDAGQAATNRSIELLWENEINTKVVSVLYGKDPDECIKHDPKVWEESLRRAVPAMQYYFVKYLTVDALSDINKKQKAVKQVLTELLKVKSKIEFDHWIRELAKLIDVNENILRESLPKSKVGQRVGGQDPRSKIQDQRSGKIAEGTPVSSFESQTLRKIFTILLNDPSLIGYATQYIKPEMISLDEERTFYKNLIVLYNANSRFDKSSLMAKIESLPELFPESYWRSLIIYIEKVYEGFDTEGLKKELLALVRNFRLHYCEHAKKDFYLAMQAAELRKDSAEVNRLLAEIQTLNEQLAQLK